jgi:hypothetical protein
MSTAAPIFPNRLPVLYAARLGRPRHFPAVLPFVRANLALRRLALAEADAAAHRATPLSVEAEADAIVDAMRRAAHDCPLP